MMTSSSALLLLLLLCCAPLALALRRSARRATTYTETTGIQWCSGGGDWHPPALAAAHLLDPARAAARPCRPP